MDSTSSLPFYDCHEQEGVGRNPWKGIIIILIGIYMTKLKTEMNIYFK
jgi:hypothetical protein